jgi:hypothetical protein
MSTLQTNKIQHLTSGFNNVVQFTDGAGTQNGTLCRAWVNFNGTSTVAIRGSFNVSSITDNGTGNYTLNFTNALTDANFAPVTASQYAQVICSVSNLTTSTAQIRTFDKGGNVDYDSDPILVAIFR